MGSTWQTQPNCGLFLGSQGYHITTKKERNSGSEKVNSHSFHLHFFNVKLIMVFTGKWNIIYTKRNGENERRNVFNGFQNKMVSKQTENWTRISQGIFFCIGWIA